ncbi:MAG TPA: TetR/AcrR family transcriptional regulator [Caulobacteraceae bacterium]|jgi:AcrR family transcriptional regulator|nr:TetR/AcrR family transcriptional regulator [Caulobacteraceae bacterium]
MAGDLRGPRGPNAERRQSTRDKILAAAVRCLSDLGYAQTSTVRVAAEAKVARGSLLHQFPTRIDLVLAVAEQCAAAQGAHIRAGLAKLPVGRERFIGSIDVTWQAFQQPESRALIEIIIASRYDLELAERIPGFAQQFEAGIARGAHRFAEASGLRDEHGEAAAERRLILVALRGLAVETMLSGAQAEADAVLALLKRNRAQFFDDHLVSPELA